MIREREIDAVKGPISCHVGFSGPCFFTWASVDLDRSRNALLFQIIADQESCSDHGGAEHMMSAAVSHRFSIRAWFRNIRFLAESV